MRRRVVLSSAAVICLSAGISAPAGAHAPSPAASAVAGSGATVCTPASKDINEISGLVATQNGYWAIQDSQVSPARPKVWLLDNACKATKTVTLSTALDPEDAAMDKNGNLLIADIGDNEESTGGQKAARPTVAVWTLAPDAKTPTISRLSYPDGKKHDAEAFLLTSDGLPIIITKTDPVEVYVAESALVTEKTVKLRKAGDFKSLQDTKTPNPLDLLGWKVVTGAAASPDGSKVVVRTYSDAYEFDVPGGDVIKALTTGKPRITPLPNEQRGEAITYTTDGKNYITASDVASTAKAPLLKYTPTNISVAPGKGADVPSPKANDQSFLKSLTLQDITYAVAAIGILGLALVIAGVVGIRRSRAARRASGVTTGNIRGGGPGGPGGPIGPGGPGGGPDGEFAAPGAPGVYGGGPGGPGGRGGGGRRGDQDPGGNVYGGGSGGQGGPGGNVYGGGGGGGGYGGPGGDRQGGGVYGGGGQGGGGQGGGSGGGRGGGGVYGGGPGGGAPGGGAPGGGGPGGGGYGGGPGGGGYGGGPAQGDQRGGYGGRDQRGFAQGPPPQAQRGGYGPGDHDGYDRGYAPHR